MRILSIAPNRFVKNNASFKADIVILPSAARDNQPLEDKIILERETENVKNELQRRFPSKNDNLQIFLQPSGFRGNSNKSHYWNEIKAFIGYKDTEKARQDILRKNQNPPNDDYVMLQPETIEKIKDRDDEVIKKLEKKVEHESTNYLKDNIADNIKLDFINDIEAIIKNALDYGLTEWEKPQVVPLSSTTGDKIDILLPNWL